MSNPKRCSENLCSSITSRSKSHDIHLTTHASALNRYQLVFWWMKPETWQLALVVSKPVPLSYDFPPASLDVIPTQTVTKGHSLWGAQFLRVPRPSPSTGIRRQPSPPQRQGRQPVLLKHSVNVTKQEVYHNNRRATTRYAECTVQTKQS